MLIVLGFVLISINFTKEDSDEACQWVRPPSLSFPLVLLGSKGCLLSFRWCTSLNFVREQCRYISCIPVAATNYCKGTGLAKVHPVFPSTSLSLTDVMLVTCILALQVTSTTSSSRRSFWDL